MATLQGKFQFKKVLSIDAEISQNVNFVSTTFFEDGSTRKLTCSAMYVVPGTADATGHLDYTIEAVEPDSGGTYPQTTEVYMDSELGWGADLVGQDVIVVVDFGDTPQEVSDEYANWVSRNTVTVSSENPAATVSYKGETLVAIAGGKSVTLRTNGKRMEDDLKIVALATGGSCDYECVIPVDELPTENIDTNAVYLCGGAYYKYAEELVDVLYSGRSVIEGFHQYTITYHYATIKPTENIAVTNVATSVMHIYYIADENNLFVYGDLANTGTNAWMTLSEALGGATFDGTIGDASEATSSNLWAVVNAGWTKYLAPTGTLEITESGTYDVSEYASAEVNVEGGGVSIEDYDGSMTIT